ncbi:phosphatidylinositol-glycan biosynthesis class S protein-domain-containing protein [Melanogaster broomeanus]|nr:phosphatidylinositol-glycan biosynthesis class S protein-domain-containing protein [Melanogaster broomeanus]
MDPTAPTTADHGLKEPQKLSFETARTRRLILASYWTIIILALPFWWNLTSIERIALPSNRVRTQLDRKPVFPVNVQLDASSFQETGPTLARALNEILVRTSQASLTWRNLDIRVGVSGLAVTVDVEVQSDDPNTYSVVLGDHTAVRHPRQLVVSRGDASAHRLGSILCSLLAPEITSMQAQRIVHYTMRYRLAFTLLNENAASDRLVDSWDIQSAIAGKFFRFIWSTDHMLPIISRLNMLHNFTIESQVQYHAPLAFEPSQLTVANNTLHGLTPEDLTVFINSAEWTLSSSVSNDPVLHFVLFIPSPAHQPLHILDAHGSPTRQNAFLLPQWGGIFILNRHAEAATVTHLTTTDLVPVFSAFGHQLSVLLGVSPLPDGVRSEEYSLLSDWQLDTLLRYRTSENTLGSQETLYSIVKLVDQIGNMPVDQEVRGDVHDALTALGEAYRSAVGSPAVALRWSGEALSLASHAFFNPGMLALLYFPAEHKYAVYTPLFASISVPLIVALGREVYAWRREQRVARNG